MMSSQKNHTARLALSALLLSAALLLPFLTGQVPQIGNALCPMHIPVLLCGFFCGPWYGLGVGFLAPLLRFLIFGMPPLFPNGLAMCFELSAYGLLSAYFYRLLPKKKVCIYISLLGAMLCGRIVWGCVGALLFGLWGKGFGWTVFFSGAFLTALPGILLQIVLIPPAVMLRNRYLPPEK